MNLNQRIFVIWLSDLALFRQNYRNFGPLSIKFIIQETREVLARLIKPGSSAGIRTPTYEVQLKDGRKIRRMSDPVSLAFALSNGWSIAEIQRRTLLLVDARGTKIKIKQDEIGMLVETFVEKPYGLEFKDKVIVDIGMNIGDTPIYFCSRGARFVIGIEPDPEAYGLALDNISLNHLERRIFPVNVAIAWKEGKLGVENPGSTLLQSRVYRWGAVDLPSRGTEEVDAIPLLSVFDKFGLAQVDLLKIDCEGCEYEVLGSLPKEAFNRIRAIALEFHDGLQDLPYLLKQNGFVVKCVWKEPEKVGILRADKQPEANDFAEDSKSHSLPQRNA